MANLTRKSKLAVIEYFKKEGNNSFKQGEYIQSLEYYANALLFLDALAVENDANGNVDDVDVEDAKQSESRKGGRRRDEIERITSTILSNLAQAHLHLHSEKPDLFDHLLCALNCCQISLHLNSANLKSATRRIVCLYRLGMQQFGDEVLEKLNKTQEAITPTTTAVIKSERDRIESQSVKYHVDRYKHALVTRDYGAFGDIELEKDVFLRKHR